MKKIDDDDTIVGSVVAFNDELAVVERDGGYQLGWLVSGDPLPPRRRTYDTLTDALCALIDELDDHA